MASIRGYDRKIQGDTVYDVRYSAFDEFRKRVHRSRRFDTLEEAERFKDYIENADNSLKTIDEIENAIPLKYENITMDSFSKMFFEGYGAKKWGVNAYPRKITIYNKHIQPDLGHLSLSSVTPITIDKFYNKLKKKKVTGNNQFEEKACLSPRTIEDVILLLKTMFAFATKWWIIERSPVMITLPKRTKGVSRAYWEMDKVRKALSFMEHNPLLHLSVHIGFVCGLRNGEAMGLTWDNIDFENSKITIEKQLQRVYKESLEASEAVHETIFKIFPQHKITSNSLLVLKSPKTTSSHRVVAMTKNLKLELLKRKRQVEQEKAFYRETYHDCNMVFCYPIGDPIEPTKNRKMFAAWQRKYNERLGLNAIDYHGLRHSYATFVYSKSGNNLNLVKEGTGHTQDKTAIGYIHAEAPTYLKQAELFEKHFDQS